MKYIKDHIVSIIILGILTLISFGSFFVDLATIRNSIESAGIWAPFLYIVAKSSTIIFAPLSGTPLYVFSVPIFGFWNALFYSLIGDLIGSIISFYISRLFGKPVVSYLTGKKNMQYIEKTLEVISTPKGFLTMRIAAIAMPEIASYAAGLSSINFIFFICVHMCIQVFPVFVASSASGLLFSQNLPQWIIVSGTICVALATVVSIFIFIFMIKQTQKKHTENQ